MSDQTQSIPSAFGQAIAPGFTGPRKAQRRAREMPGGFAPDQDLELHREAELLMGLADQAMAQGRPNDAAKLNRRAAEIEAQVFDLLPLDRPKTRGITAVSSVALFRKSRAFGQAIRHARRFLSLGGIAEAARADLADMLDDMQATRDPAP